jgi:UDP-N-acetylmuramoyl-L-alanyl-D-glutamate--2,6-diaminopimelate ligase
MDLNNLLKDYAVQNISGVLPGTVTGFTADSKRVRPGFLYVCIRGMSVDGHRFALEAAANGAAAVASEYSLPLPVPVIRVADTRNLLSFVAHRYYGEPSRKIRVTGITGTNGKTTTAHFLHHIYRSAGTKAALMGTMGVRVDESYLRQVLTTPESEELHRTLWRLLRQDVRAVAMEVSSHALVQKRVEHCRFACAIFTNLTREHLDYHGDMEKYFAAKARLFSLLEQDGGSAVINADDSRSGALISMAGKNIWTYGIKREADVRALELLGLTEGGTFIRLKHPGGETAFSVCLHGIYNVYNALAAATAALAEGIDIQSIVKGIESLSYIPGRLELLPSPPGIRVFLDYAHTPDGLKKVLQAVREYPHRKIIVVFGCRGSRDRGKRPQMGRIAEIYTHKTILTSDNPADEDPQIIAGEIAAGMQKRPVYIKDRRQAIHYAIDCAQPGDIVLITGKGRENYQLVGNIAIPYSDPQAVEECCYRHTTYDHQ